jgi:hypothetical protein
MTMAIYRVSLTLKRLCLMTLSLTIRYTCCVWSGITHFARSAEKERPFRLLHS